MILDGIPPPSAPISEPWELSIGGIVRRGHEVPSIAGKALGLLDRFGALRLRPESVGFDDQDVEWSRLVEVRIRPIAEVLSQNALNREIERVRKLLPPVPGRKWVLTKLGASLGELTRDAMTRVNPEGCSRTVVSELVYRGSLGRTRQITGGVIVSAILAAMPAANNSILVTAQSHAIAVVE